MKFIIKHEMKGRIRIHALLPYMTCKEADILNYYLSAAKFVTSVKVYEKTQDAVITYPGSRSDIIELLRNFSYDKAKAEVPEAFLQNSGRSLNEEYWEKLVWQVILRYGVVLLAPMSVRTGIVILKSAGRILKAIKTIIAGRLEVAVLDAVAVGVSVIRRDIETASSIMFLLGVGDILEEWTHKRSVGDLARSMSLNVNKVWLLKDGQEILVPAKEVCEEDKVIVRIGNVIPFDGIVDAGEAMVNQVSITGESMPVCKNKDKYVYAGTVVEDGELIIRVKETGGSSRFEKIVKMIEESEKLKSSLEGKAEHLADRLVPYTLGGAALTWLLTRNITKALSVLMVDFSCALKLAMPISVLSAIREASLYNITVKGGKYLEAMAEADIIVFDKTGTLTKAQPEVAEVLSFNGEEPDELLRIAACLEEHFPHSMAKAVVDAAKKKNLVHEELHSKVEYIVAHGISTQINGKKAVIGSYHFVFEDEDCIIPEAMNEKFEAIPEEYSTLYLAIENRLAAVICIKDPVRKESAAIINSLKKLGIEKVVMMTGDNERTARAIAAETGIDEYYSEVLPEDKAGFIEKEKAVGKKVIMIGDGINDSPALSAADVGIAVSDGAEIAREIADVTIGADNLYEIVTLKAISDGLMKRINKNYREIVGFNTGLLLLGAGGVLQPAASAMLHNTSTLAISLRSMRNLLT